MTDEPNKLPPLRLNPADQENDTRDIRRRAIERQTTAQVEESDQRERDEGGSRRIYPSDIERRQRTITVTFPDQDMMEYLKSTAEQLSKERGEEVSPTRLATLILIAGLDQWRQGKLVIAKEAMEVETIVIKPAK
jgi:hypothetical protein